MRKTIAVEITEEGRDKGKKFFITEMSAPAAERWARRALAEMVKAGADIPADVHSAGFAGLLSVGIKGVFGISGPETDALYDEMMACVQIMPDPKHPELKRALIEDDCEEIATILKLRGEVLSLHTGFSIAAALSKAWAAAKVKLDQSSQNTSTSAPS